MKINVLKKGDSVLNVTSEFIAVRRKDGTVDLIPLKHEGEGLRVDTRNILTIAYGDNTVETTSHGVTVTHF